MLAFVSSRPGRTRRRWAWLVLALLVAVALELAIRAGEPRTVGPTGVDMLQIPLREPAPASFVAEVDHPWLPLDPGARWRLGDREVVVAAEPYEVAGIATTVVTASGVDRFVAQDRDGNVWLLGERSHEPRPATPGWSVADGSPAGLVLPAEPRRGDGWATVVPSGEVRGTTRVIEIERAVERGSERIEAGDRARLVLAISSEPVATGAGPVREVVVRLERGRGPVEVVLPGAGVLRRVDRP